METCENCNRTIGKLETPFIHGDHVVCAECKGRLIAASKQKVEANTVASPATPRRVIKPSPPATGRAPVAEFRATQEQGVQAITIVVARLGYTLQNIDRANGLVTFETGMSWLSWAGQKMSAHVMDLGDRVQVSISGTRKAHGAHMQIFDWGEARKIANKVFAELRNTLR